MLDKRPRDDPRLETSMPPRARRADRTKPTGTSGPAAQGAPARTAAPKATTAPTPADFEKLGVFYLGRPYDLTTKQPSAAPLLYDSKDLVTHAVCVGMTGSGKTGLCLGLL